VSTKVIIGATCRVISCHNWSIVHGRDILSQNEGLHA
jgi:hypothetical protein